MKTLSPSAPVLPADRIITTREAAALLGVALSTAQVWMESGAIQSWKTPGGHRRCRVSAVQAVIDGACAAQADPGPAPALADEFLVRPNATYPTLPDEAARLAALAACGLMDSPPEPRFDRHTWLASQLTGAPMALVSLLSSGRQWFKARTGVDTVETPREWAFCSHAILHQDGLTVPDAALDPRFCDNPLVTAAPFIRFYAGLPICDAQGQRLGTLCVLDSAPRALTPAQLRGLSELAQMASLEIARG